MPLVDISRWQFGATTVYHFLFVPLTIGLAPLVAIMETLWVITGSILWYRATRFFGKLFLINFALGVATGLVQEFQFGMNWSKYSRFVGDVFGAPLAFEALIAFFMESTFIGIWLFGWGRIPKKIHLACIWLVAFSVHASAYFIIAANSFMQHPVGAKFNERTHRLQLTSIWQVVTNPTTLIAFPHTVIAAWLTGATFVAGVAGMWMVRVHYQKDPAESGESTANTDPSDTDPALNFWRPIFRLGLYSVVFSGVLLLITGDIQGKVMFKQQPMKMASAESLCQRTKGADFSILTIGTHNNCDSIKRIIVIPHLTSFLATNTFNSTLDGVYDIEKQDTKDFGPGNYRPNLFVTYWAFRFMIGWAAGSAALAGAGLWLSRKKRVSTSKHFARLCILAIPTPFLANSCGWIFTEMGRAPWVVVPNLDHGADKQQIKMLIANGVSNHPVSSVVISLVVFCVLYGILGLIWLYLQTRYVIQGPDPYRDPYELAPEAAKDDVPQLSFVY